MVRVPTSHGQGANSPWLGCQLPMLLQVQGVIETEDVCDVHSFTYCKGLRRPRLPQMD